MHIHHLQHVAFEGLGSMESFLLSKGHQPTACHLYKGDSLSSVTDIDWLSNCRCELDGSHSVQIENEILDEPAGL